MLPSQEISRPAFVAAYGDSLNSWLRDQACITTSAILLCTRLVEGGRATPVCSGFRCPCKIDEEYFDCVVDFVSQPKISPGQTADVRLTFLSIELVVSRLRVSDSYKLCEGERPVGEVRVTEDIWHDIDSLVSEGEVRRGVVDSIGWTKARLSVEGGIITDLSSEDVGLRPWDEIGQTLHCGDAVKVRVERIDRDARSIKISFIEKTQ